jgi:hypothetical protein
MTTSAEHISRDLATLENKSSAVAQELAGVYEQYLQALSQGMQGQLISACYHLCTQMFPQVFLELSYSQRAQLQQELQTLGQKAGEALLLPNLLKHMAAQQKMLEVLEQGSQEQEEMDPEDSASPELSGQKQSEQPESSADAKGTEKTKIPGAKLVDSTPTTTSPTTTSPATTSPATTSPATTSPATSGHEDEDEDEDENEVDSEIVLELAEGIEGLSLEDFELDPELVKRIVQEFPGPVKVQAIAVSMPEIMQPPPIDGSHLEIEPMPMPDTPQKLFLWRKQIEQAIADVLRTTSQQATQLLEKSNILENSLPAPILQAATQSGAAEASGGPPNLLNLVVEMGKDGEESKVSKPIQIVAVYLRLSEIEFSDATISVWRKKIRSFDQQLFSLQKSYKRKKRERAIAEAQDAWRSSWTNG